MQKSTVFLYIFNGQSEIPLKITSKRIKYLEINLTKDVYDLYPEIYTILLNEGTYR